MRRRREVSLLLSALLSAASISPAAPPSARGRVAIVFTDGIDEERGVLHDVPLELRVEGFQVMETEKESADGAGGASFDRARRGGARAILHVVRGPADGATIEVFLVTPDGVRLKDTVPCPPSDTSDLASVRAVEVLRAALLETPPPVPSWTPAVEPTRAPERPRNEPEPRFAVAALPTVLIGGSAPLAFFDVALKAEYLPTDQLGFELDGAFPLASASEATSQATARIRAAWIVAGGSYFLSPKARFLRPFVGARAGAVFLTFDTAGNFPFIGASGETNGFFAALAGGVSIRLLPLLRLRVEGAVGLATPQVVLRFDGLEIDRLGAPLVQLGLGPEVTW